MARGNGAESANVASHLARSARDRPHAIAISSPRRGGGYAHWSYRQLHEQSARIGRGLRAIGIERGTRTVVMVPPSPELFALVFALFEIGAPLVMVDPGMGTKHLGECLDRAEPRAFVGVPRAHMARALFGWGRRTIEKAIVVGARPLAFALRDAFSLDEVRRRGETAGAASAEVTPDELAAILFTSGSTGAPKGALYRHATFTAQLDAIRDMYEIRPGEIDLPTFPLFALFDPALGMQTILPEMDSSRPASVDPKNVIGPIHTFGVTNMFGSPALLDTVAAYGVRMGVKLPTLMRVISAGAPVAPRILEAFAKMLPEGARIHTPYGATEALPVATIAHDEVLGETRAETDRGGGTCVGRPVPIARLELIEITDDPIERWEDARPVERGVIGEIVVRGPQVTHAYAGEPIHTARAKIETPDGIAHRMGDLGRIDAQGRIWFCGRKSHRVRLEDGTTLFTIPTEGPFNAHRAVKRSALVGPRIRGRIVPVICIEPWEMPRGSAARRLIDELLELSRQHETTKRIERVLLHEGFPVDVRHNAKIRREDLVLWAAREIR